MPVSFLTDEQLSENGKGRPANSRPKMMNDFIDDMAAKKNKKGCCC